MELETRIIPEGVTEETELTKAYAQHLWGRFKGFEVSLELTPEQQAEILKGRDLVRSQFPEVEEEFEQDSAATRRVVEILIEARKA